MSGCDLNFRAMGCDVRIIIDGSGPNLPDPAESGAAARRFIERYDARLSRFRPDSELCALNTDPREVVPASRLLRAAVRSGIWGAERSRGLVDPTMLDELEDAGYTSTRDGVVPAPLIEALVLAPERRPAAPNPGSRWRQIVVDDAAGVVRRPPGVRFDNGGTGKGLAADLVAERLRGYPRFVVDCGGDLRIGGTAAKERPFEVLVEHPLTLELDHTITVSGAGVATSGLNVRVWRNPDGRFSHHLLDPSTGRPAWTGLVGATALAATALEAETLAKAALLLGADGARALLAARGGLLVHETRETELVGAIAAHRCYSITVPSSLAKSPVAA